MSKKATFWGLGLLVALGLSATAASHWSSIAQVSAVTSTVAETDDSPKLNVTIDQTAYAPGDSANYCKYATPLSVTPAPGAEVKASENVSQIQINFYKYISIDYAWTGEIVIKKDGETVQTITSKDNALSYATGLGYDLLINVNPLTAPGTYTVDFPAKVVSVADQDGVANAAKNFACNWTFTVIKDINFSVSPAGGTQFAQISKGQQFEFLFPEGSTVSVDKKLAEPEDEKTGARFMYSNNGTTDAKQTFAMTVTLEAKGNKLVATADADFFVNMTALTDSWGAYIVIPKGAVSVTLDGETTVMPQMQSGKYYTLAIPQSAIELTPAPGPDYLKPEQLKNMTLKFNVPGTVTMKSGTMGPGGSFGYMYFCIKAYDLETKNVTGSYVAAFNITPVEGTNEFKLEMKPATNTTALQNNPENWERGAYALSISANQFTRTDEAANISAAGNILTNIGPLMVDTKQATMLPSSVVPATSALNPATGLGVIKLTFPKAVEAVSDKNIKIYKKGDEANPLFTIASNDTKYVAVSSTSVTITLPSVIKNVLGDYVLSIEEGAFRQTSGNNLPTEAITETYTFPEVLENTVSPQTGFVSELSKITITFPGATSIKIVDPEVKISVLGGAAGTSSQTTMTGEAEGNTVTFTLAKSFNTPNAYPYNIEIPGSYMIVTKDGKEYPNVPMPLTYTVEANLPPTFSPAAGNVNADKLDEIKLTPAPGLSVASYTPDVNARVKLLMLTPEGKVTNSAQYVYLQYQLKTERYQSGVNDDGEPIYENRIVKDADGSVYLQNDHLYNSEAIVSGDYALYVPATAITYSQGEGDDATEFKYKGVYNVFYNVTASATQSPISISVPPRVEELPRSFYIEAPEGCKLSYYKGFAKEMFCLTSANNINYACRPDSVFEDGRLKLTLDSAAYAVLNDPSSNYHKGLYGTWTLKLATTYGTISATSGNFSNGNFFSPIPAATFCVTDANGKTSASEATTITFNVTGPITDPVYTITPLNGSDPRTIENITIATDSDVPLATSANSIQGFIMKDGVQVGTFSTADLEQTADNIMVLNLAQPLKDAGTYNIVFPRGFFLIGTLKTPSSELRLTYNVLGLESLEVKSIDPADESVLTSFTGITLNFDDVEIESVEQAADIVYTVQNPAVDFTSTTGYKLEPVINSDKKSILLTFSEEDEAALKQAGNWPVCDPGFYTINVDPNAIIMTAADGTVYGNTFVKAVYTVAPETNIEFAPDATVEWYPELKEMTITFPDMKTVTKNEFAFAQITLSKGTTDIPVSVSVKDNVVTVTAQTAQTEVGSYTLDIPAQCLLLTPSAAGKAPYYNVPLSHVFQIAERPHVTRTTPANNSTLEFYTNTMVFFSGDPKRNYDCEAVATLAKNGEIIRETTNKSGTYFSYAGGEDDPTQINFNWSRDKKEFGAGTFTMTVPAGFVLVAGVPTPAEDLVLTYTVEGSTEYSVTPADGSVLTDLSEVVLTFPGVKSIKNNELYAESSEGGGGPNLNVGIYIVNSTADDPYPYEYTTEGNTLTLKLTPAVKLDEGTTSVSLSAGSLDLTMEDGTVRKNTPIRVEYLTPNVAIPTLTFNEEADRGDLAAGEYPQNYFAVEKVTATMPDGHKFGVINGGTTTPLILKSCDEAGNYIGADLARWCYDFAEEGTALGRQSIGFYLIAPYKVADLQNLPEGRYVVYMKKGTLTMQLDEPDEDGFDYKVCSTPVSWFFDLKSVQSVGELFGDAKEFNIYSVDGKVIKLNGNIDDVKDLEPGLYIINGRNVYLRK